MDELERGQVEGVRVKQAPTSEEQDAVQLPPIQTTRELPWPTDLPESAFMPSAKAEYQWDNDGIPLCGVIMSWFAVPSWIVYCDKGEVVVRWERVRENAESEMVATYSIAFYPYNQNRKLRVRTTMKHNPRLLATCDRKPIRKPHKSDMAAIHKCIQSHGWCEVLVLKEPR